MKTGRQKREHENKEKRSGRRRKHGNARAWTTFGHRHTERGTHPGKARKTRKHENAGTQNAREREDEGASTKTVATGRPRHTGTESDTTHPGNRPPTPEIDENAKTRKRSSKSRARPLEDYHSTKTVVPGQPPHGGTERRTPPHKPTKTRKHDHAGGGRSEEYENTKTTATGQPPRSGTQSDGLHLLNQ